MARQENVPQTVPAATHKQRMCSRSFIAIDFLAYKNSLGYVTPSPGKAWLFFLIPIILAGCWLTGESRNQTNWSHVC